MNLDKRINKWRDGLHKYKGIEPSYMDELEDHLRSDIDGYLENGLSEKEAFEKAITALAFKGEELSSSFIRYRKRSLSPFFILKNHITTSFRTLQKNFGLTALNVTGLILGISTFLLINIFVYHEVNVDQFHVKKEDIYRVSHQFFKNGNLEYHGAATFPKVGPALKEEFPEVVDQCRLFKKYRPATVKYEDRAFREDNVYYADPSFFNLFSYPLLSGDPKTVLKEPNTGIIDKKTAEKYFGDDDPVGKRISVGSMDGTEHFEIVGVFESVKNSYLQFSMIFSYSSYVNIYQDADYSWGWYDFYTYLLMDPTADIEAFEKQLPAFADRHGGERLGSKQLAFSLQPMEDIYFTKGLTYEPHKVGDSELIRILVLISVFILAVAWVNYVNLYTSKSIARAKEVGIRKVLGSSRTNLLWQFMSEALVVNAIAIIIGLGLLQLVLPWFSDFSEMKLSSDHLWTISNLAVIFLLWLLSSLISGYYPARILSKFQPIPAIKGLVKYDKSGVTLRRVLTTLQFVISASLISLTLVIYSQVQFIRDQGIKIETDDLLVIRTPDEITDSDSYMQQLETLRNKLKTQTQVQVASLASEIPGKAVDWWGGVRRKEANREDRTTIYRIGVDEFYLDLYGDVLVAGRNFRSTDESKVVMNEKAIELLGYTSPEAALNNQVITSYDTMTIVGVTANFHQESVKEEIKPTLFINHEPDEMKFLTMRVSNKGEDFLKVVEAEFENSFPGTAFDYFFVEDHLENQMATESAFLKSFIFFSAIAILISMIGLIGLSSFLASQRTKEICIRKILGSSPRKLFLLLTNELFVFVIIANLISIPIVYWFSMEWLNQFANRIDFNFIYLMITLVLTVLATILTTSKDVLMTISQNPADRLRLE